MFSETTIRRYQNDVNFHYLVDSLTALITSGQFSPDDIRSALELGISNQNRFVPIYGTYYDVANDADWEMTGEAAAELGRRAAALENLTPPRS